MRNIFSVLFLSFIICVMAQNEPQWTYAGQKDWGKYFVHCGDETGQSPINIVEEEVVPGTLPPMQFFNFDIDHKLTLFNDGHSLIGVVENDLLRPYVLIGSKLFKFHQWQSHWIKDGERSSEHSINGQFFDWESHMIFYDAKYLTFEEASKHENGVAIFARFGKVIAGLTDGILDNVLSVINNILRPGNVTYVIDQILVTLVNVLGLRSYTTYSYQGSLTTPACSPGVNWYIISVPIALTEKNYEALWSLRDDNGNPIITNVRYSQKVGLRQVLGSF